ncbi:MAG: peptide-methionine (S)-S-oxide reductase [Thermomicrobiales bacterium]
MGLLDLFKPAMVKPDKALAGRETYSYSLPATHAVLGTPIQPPFPDGLEIAYFGLGCFWGAERKFWQTPGVYSTAVGYQGGFTPYPTYKETCTGDTGHTEAVMVVFDPKVISYEALLQLFWESSTIRPRGCVRATMSAPSTDRPSTRSMTPSSRLAESTRDAYQASLTVG